MLLLSIAFMPLSQTASHLLWLAGTALHLVITLYVVNAWMQLGRFAKLRFFLSWWAYSFPLAAIVIASLSMHEQTGAAVYLYVGGGLLVVLTGIVALLLAKTFGAVRKHGICVPEH